MFRGKDSSNRIELSRLVQELLNFGVSGSLRLWGVGGWVDVVGTPVIKNSIALELIEIFQFCLKI